ncbi:MAG: hypothetical protein NTX56_07755 [Proteobacteria bacterium]|nr:hypothetical protein [Pseudomonadota bacterium]
MKILQCPSCGAQNRVEQFSVRQHPLCGRCKHPLQEPKAFPILRFLARWKFWLILAVIVGGSVVFDQFGTKPSPSARKAASAPAFNQPIVPISQGVYRRYTNREALAPFRIVTPAGSENYFVKLVEAGSGAPVMAIFIRGGQSFETEVPLGVLRVKYATGATWYGDQHLFGPATQYSEADKTFEIAIEGNQISGYTVELIRQRAGNLHTKSISSGQF